MRKRNKYNLSNYKLMTGNMGYLYPISFYDVLPGDTFKLSSTLLVRCSPLVAPVMHPVNVTVHHFFVPYRLIWDKFEDFITGGSDGDDDDVIPIVQLGGDYQVAGSLANYFGIPSRDGLSVATVNALPFRAYNFIWNEFYRDQDLQAEVDQSDLNLKKVNVEKDYFTTARPSPQKGTAVSIPLDLDVRVPARNISVRATMGGADANLRTEDSSGDVKTANKYAANIEFSGSEPAFIATVPAAGLTLKDLSVSTALQKWKEKRNMYGSRYSEYLASLGVKSSDSRLQRPEYLGGGQRTIQFSEIVNTGDSSDSPIGSLKGHGINSTRSNTFVKFFSEHGLIMSFAFIRPKNLYSTSMPRYFLKRTRVDFWNKELEQLGQQPIYISEIDAVHNLVDPSYRGVFGWTYNYDEYRKSFNTVAGDFSYGKADNNWHFAREFAVRPVLNSDFVESNPTTRPFALTDTKEHHFHIMAYNSVIARRLVGKGKVTTF